MTMSSLIYGYRDWVEFVTSKYEDKKIYDVDDLITACREGSYREVIAILDHHNRTAGPNDYNEDGQSALYHTLSMILTNESYPLLFNIEEFSYFSILLNNKLRKSTLRNHNWSNIEVIILTLLHRGGDVDFVRLGKDGNEHQAIMHLAASLNDLTMLSWLCSRGADVSILSFPSNRTPLSVAVERDHIQAVIFLIRHGAVKTIDCKDVNGWTALHYAAAYSSVELAKVLLLCGASPSIKSNAGYRPFEEAQRRRRGGMVDMLTKYKDTELPYQKRMNFLDDIYKDRHEPELFQYYSRKVR